VPMSSIPKHCAWYVLQKCGWLCGILAGGSCPSTMVDLTSFISLPPHPPHPSDVSEITLAELRPALAWRFSPIQALRSLSETGTSQQPWYACVTHAPVDVLQLRNLRAHTLHPHRDGLRTRAAADPRQPTALQRAAN
jgi:hypothetical protein